jgi:hypothetical protein
MDEKQLLQEQIRQLSWRIVHEKDEEAMLEMEEITNRLMFAGKTDLLEAITPILREGAQEARANRAFQVIS